MSETYRIRVGRVVLASTAVDETQARRLRAAILESLNGQLLTGPLPPPAIADNVQIDIPPFALTSPEGERRAAHFAATAIVRALRGEM
jgi:hypothetical protein